MEQFKIKQDGFKEFRKTILIKSIPMTLIAVAGGLAISYFNISKEGGDFIKILPLVLPIILSAIFFGSYLTLKRQKSNFDSYKLTINDNELLIEQLLHAKLTIIKSEITEILKNLDGSFIIKTNTSKSFYEIPSYLENNKRLEMILSEIQQIKLNTNKTFLQKYSWLFALVPIILMALVHLSDDKIIVGIAGSVLIAIFGFAFNNIKKNENFGNNINKILFFIIVISFSILFRIYTLIIVQ